MKKEKEGNFSLTVYGYGNWETGIENASIGVSSISVETLQVLQVKFPSHVALPLRAMMKKARWAK